MAMSNSLNIVEVCATQPGARFIVYDDGCLYVEPTRNAPLQPFDGDGAAYLNETASAVIGDRRQVNNLVPNSLRTEWGLGFQKEAGYAVFTLYPTQPPSIKSLGIPLK